MKMATIIISVILVAIVALIIRGLIQDRKGGKSSCGGSCGSCGACAHGGQCHMPQQPKKKV